MIQLNNENLGFKGDIVLHDIFLNINVGERVALVGESGSGKSTLLAALQSRYQTNCAYVPQDPGPVRSLSVFHNVYIGNLHRHMTSYNLLNLVWPQKKVIEQISPIVERLGLLDKLFTRAGELSGGQQQRTAICRPSCKVAMPFWGMNRFRPPIVTSRASSWIRFAKPSLPSFWLGSVIIQTVAFALCGVALGAFSGFFLAQVFHIGPIRWACAFVRAIHELFWALILLQILGLTPLTNVLAIAIPYAGICAKAYAETLEESQPAVLQVLPMGSGIVSSFFYARLPDVWVHIKNYTGYRFECGLRSSAALGFVGLPTLGFYLETAFSEGNYSEAAALLILFYILIASLHHCVTVT